MVWMYDNFNRTVYLSMSLDDADGLSERSSWAGGWLRIRTAAALGHWIPRLGERVSPGWYSVTVRARSKSRLRRWPNLSLRRLGEQRNPLKPKDESMDKAVGESAGRARIARRNG